MCGNILPRGRISYERLADHGIVVQGQLRAESLWICIHAYAHVRVYVYVYPYERVSSFLCLYESVVICIYAL